MSFPQLLRYYRYHFFLFKLELFCYICATSWYLDCIKTYPLDLPMNTIRTYGGLRLKMELPAPEMPILEVPPPKNIILPLSDRPGIFCRSLVERGETIFKGEKVAEDPSNRMTPIHASVSGKVTDIDSYRYAEGGNTRSIFIESDGEEAWKTELSPLRDIMEADPIDLMRIIREAGVKIIPFETLPAAERAGTRVTPVRYFVVNGIGHGFVGSIARRLLVERSSDLVEATGVIRRMLQPEKVYLVISNEHEDVIRASVESGLQEAVEIVKVSVYYPLGHPHLLFKELFGREIPSPHGKAIDEGVVFANVDTMIHTLEAVKLGKPLIERYITVSGGGIRTPKNLKARIGTPLKDLIEVCGGFEGTPGRLVLGNPLDGMAQFSLDRPVLKDTRWLWVETEEHVVKDNYRACINCGECVDVCPVRLMPNFLGKFCEFSSFEEAAAQYDLYTCIDCGLCAYVCPSRRPLVQFINYGKQELARKEKENAAG